MTPQDINANYIADLYGETYLAEENPAARTRLAVRALFPGIAVVAIASAAATWFLPNTRLKMSSNMIPVIFTGVLQILAG